MDLEGCSKLGKKLIYGASSSLFSRYVREGMYLNPLAELINHDEDVFVTPCWGRERTKHVHVDTCMKASKMCFRLYIGLFVFTASSTCADILYHIMLHVMPDKDRFTCASVFLWPKCPAVGQSWQPCNTSSLMVVGTIRSNLTGLSSHC